MNYLTGVYQDIFCIEHLFIDLKSWPVRQTLKVLPDTLQLTYHWQTFYDAIQANSTLNGTTLSIAQVRGIIQTYSNPAKNHQMS